MDEHPPPPDTPPPGRHSGQALRILDANANRAAEGLRVVEDHLRFVLQDRSLANQCKRLRHALAAALEGFDRRSRCQVRDTQADVGRRLETVTEYQRTSPLAVALANLQRVSQALRCLEEYGKLLDASLARQVEQFRYESYELERAVTLAATQRSEICAVQLYVLADGGDSADDFRRRVEQLVRAGVGAIQLRDKDLPDRELLQRARLLCDVTRGSSTLTLINDRPDVALLARADGVHLGQDDLEIRDVRSLAGPQLIVGVSAHSLPQAQQAVRDGADYIGVGPTFASRTKDFAGFTGVELLQQVHRQIRLPAFAIGGITLDQLSAVLATGNRRVAVCAAIWQSAAPAVQVREFLRQLAGAPTAADPQRTGPLTADDHA